MVEKKLRVGVIGSGKRVRQFYFPILLKLQKEFELVGFTTRTRENGEKLAIDSAVPFFSDASTLVEKKNPDVLVVAVAPYAMADMALSLLSLNVPLLLETPVDSPQLVTAVLQKNHTVGIVEQWPFLPIEQFKAKMIESGLIKRPFFAQNDCRSLDYHAIAQLRNYIGRNHFPVSAVGHALNVDMSSYHDATGGTMNAGCDLWNIGSIKMNNGALLQHTFAYSCKKAPFRGLQTLRFNSQDGTVTTGKLDDKNNDYEILDFRLLRGHDTRKLTLDVQRDSHGNVVRIIEAGGTFCWNNPYAEYQLDDHSIAITTHLSAMRNTIQKGAPSLYTIQDAYVDMLCIQAIKQSASCGKAVIFDTHPLKQG